MFFKTLLVFSVLGALGNGIPLESPTDDMSKFFTPHSQRIVGGQAAPEGFAPHMAALVVGYQFVSLVCGGSIVAPDKILTAAHCIDGFVVWGELMPTFHAMVGSNRWDRGTEVFFKDFVNHPEWDWATIKNDIGFLILDKPLTLSRNVDTIGVSFKRIGEEKSYVTGWGMLWAWGIIPDWLQVLHVQTMEHEKCVEAISNANVGPSPPVNSAIEICTFHSVGHGVCNGDSGSALVWKKTLELIGIVSWGWPCARGAPDVFVRPSGFVDFICNVMGKDYCSSKLAHLE